jgi:tRNA A37 threonylcarbamoyladenosine modification protein TsaB
VSVTSLELLAHGAYGSGVRGTFVSAVDARRGELFVQTFSLGDELTARSEPEVIRPDALRDEWARRNEPVTFGGDGVWRYEAELRELSRAMLLDLRVPPSIVALSLGAVRTPESAVSPMYLREADAVANFSTRDRSS